MLEVREVSLRLGDKQVLSDFSLVLRAGERACLFGPSGCGKTTLLRVAAGLLRPDGGAVIAPKGQRRSFVFQEDRLLPWQSALGNLTAVGIDREKAREALARVGLAGEEETMPEKLSGGMRRRVAIARALAFGGDMFFLDEPLRGLDAQTAARVLEAMREAMRGGSALVITHDMQEAAALCDTLIEVKGLPLRVQKRAAL